MLFRWRCPPGYPGVGLPAQVTSRPPGCRLERAQATPGLRVLGRGWGVAGAWLGAWLGRGWGVAGVWLGAWLYPTAYRQGPGVAVQTRVGLCLGSPSVRASGALRGGVPARVGEMLGFWPVPSADVGALRRPVSLRRGGLRGRVRASSLAALVLGTSAVFKGSIMKE